MDKFRDECGLMGVWNHREAANLAYLGLFAQQHRGQEGAGVVSSQIARGSKFSTHKGLGLVADVFGDFDFSTLPGRQAIGHVRYTTAGANVIANVQPFTAEIGLGRVAIAHNGNLINTDLLREDLIKTGAIFGTTSDTEIFLHLLARASKKASAKANSFAEALIEALSQVRGAYSLVVMFEDRMFAVRDPGGFRPLSIGTLNDSILIASETCAFDLLDAKHLKDVRPGEIVEISETGETTSYFPFKSPKESACIFEYIYFARPDSNVFGRNVYRVRKRLGKQLAREWPVKADVVIPVPDSGVTAAIGYAEEAGLPLELGLIRNHYVGRTFIEPKQSIRDFGVRIKLNANPEVLKDKIVVVVDDSIVRGTTSQKLVKMLRSAGAKELHMRISAPPTIDPCYYGIDTPQKGDLIASKMSTEEIRKFLGADTLAYLSVEGMVKAVKDENTEHLVSSQDACSSFCDACFTGAYPIGTPADFYKKQAELFKTQDCSK